MSYYTPATVGMPVDEVDTPALLLDLEAFDRNLERLMASVAGTGVTVRPHAKSHKCPQIALRQMAAGAVGVCCQKVSEAEALVDGGVPDVLIANEVVLPAKLKRLAALARRARVAICADDPRNVDALAQAAQAAGVQIEVLVEVDVGAGRCGVQPGEPAVALARQILASPHLRFGGLQAYHGGAQHLRTQGERQAAIQSACDKVTRTTALLEAAGIPCPRVTGAGTGTYLIEAGSRVYTELQAGSYIFMDVDYARNNWEGSNIPAFEHSLFVLTSVMSCTTPGRAVVDAGLKASSVDSGLPKVFDLPGAEYTRPSDEHGMLRLAEGSTLPLGKKLRLVPGHCDPTVNLYDHFVCVRGGRVEALWPITARGALL